MRADDQEGVIRIQAVGALLRKVSELTIRVGLDQNAQTRIDLAAYTGGSGSGLGTNARRIRRFLTRLDTRLQATPDQILPAES